MIIDGKKLANSITTHLKKEIEEGVAKGWEAPKLVIFSVKPNEEISTYVQNKQKKFHEIGGISKVVLFKKTPRFEEFMAKLATFTLDPSTSGVIIQLPMPPALGTMTLMDYIPDIKEIEGFKKKTQFDPPIGLAVLTMLKSVFAPVDYDNPESVFVDVSRDVQLFKSILKRKKIVVLGRGMTGGQPVGTALSKCKINYININSQTPHPEEYLEQADIIISCVGKTIIKPEHVKPGAVLISVGLHKTPKGWQGDYVDKDIENLALAYSPTPGGVGPMTVAYLLANVVKAWKMHHEKK